MLHSKSLLYSLTVGLLFMGTHPIMAQSSSTRVNDPITQVYFKPPADEGKPDKTQRTGSRGECYPNATLNLGTNESSLIALVPTSNYGLTLAERPTFFIAVPKTSAKQIILSIRENGTQHHSQTLISIKDSPGIIEIKPSESAPPLEVGKKYRWDVVLVCGEKPGPNDPAIASWVRRVDLPQPVPPQLNQESAIAQAVWYGERGLWYDTLSALVEAKRSQPGSQVIGDIWTNFLDSVGLQSAVTTPLRF